MNKKYSELLQNHSLHYLEMAFRTDKCALLESPDGYGKRKGACGDTVEMFILVRNERIQAVTFTSNGCLNTHVCANTVALLAEGKSVNDAWSITPEQVKNYLETLPAEDMHCAELAAGALYLALVNYREHKDFPWKKLYRRK
ncbi:MAG: iron-sulfur cluster assembly scaffold protein [Desulfobacterales bacterium]|uniref:Iron-sulfur cluster assembly scaffold protein n=1 Tax=Candidatus Desulfatibia vada TaxID=2841696 RepID=A0A8J6NSX3_9BACT|nr:iron-sulfur cluster assembly scaffold protein [Candidatus Desulfatibia vada]MBL6971438.1 iron-sulfur cluster assembly scaffold protein [Desulfobacterales bacterium]